MSFKDKAKKAAGFTLKSMVFIPALNSVKENASNSFKRLHELINKEGKDRFESFELMLLAKQWAEVEEKTLAAGYSTEDFLAGNWDPSEAKYKLLLELQEEVSKKWTAEKTSAYLNAQAASWQRRAFYFGIATSIITSVSLVWLATGHFIALTSLPFSLLFYSMALRSAIYATTCAKRKTYDVRTFLNEEGWLVWIVRNYRQSGAKVTS